MKRIVALLLLCVTLAGCSGGTYGDGSWYFDPDMQVAEVSVSCRITDPDSMAFMEEEVRRLGGAIIECSVVGGSYNITEARSKYVSTPMRIDRIIWQSDTMDLAVKDIRYLYEDFYYLTPEMVDYDTAYGEAAIAVSRYTWYNPLMRGHSYILYVTQTVSPDEFKDPVVGKPLLCPVYTREGVYPLVSRETAEQILPCTLGNYWKIWEEVTLAYGN